MRTRFVSVVVDSTDPARLGRWWAAVLGWKVTFEAEGETCVEAVGHAVGASPPELTFVAAPVVSRSGAVGLHLDLTTVTTSHQRDVVDGLLDSGARHADVGQPHDAAYVVLADPEGNPFCVLEPRAEYQDTGPIAAVVLDSLRPPELASFWTAASGWARVDGDERLVRLRHPDGTGPYLELIRVSERHVGKLTRHLDVAPPPDGEQAVEVDRLVGLGARTVDVGQLDVAGDRLPGTTWEVLADPEGHELCVLTPR